MKNLEDSRYFLELSREVLSIALEAAHRRGGQLTFARIMEILAETGGTDAGHAGPPGRQP
jgi:hypothetical protein